MDYYFSGQVNEVAAQIICDFWKGFLYAQSFLSLLQNVTQGVEKH